MYELISTEERVKILRNVLYQREVSVTEIAKEAKVSKALVSKIFNIIVKEKILSKKKRKFVVNDNIRIRTLKIFLNLCEIDEGIFKKFKFVRGVGIFGSFVKGENSSDSDMDMWILIDKTREEELARLSRELRKRYTNLKPLYLTQEKLKALRERDKIFYYSLVFGSIPIYGEKIE